MKRFWKEVSVKEDNGNYSILLDERLVKTPKRSDLMLPNKAMADAVAQEWRDISEKIDPSKMPMTGFANATLDRVAGERDQFIDAVAAFGETDFFCYRADNPQKLIDRQEAQWGRWITWAQDRYNCKFEVVQGIIHKEQPTETCARLKEAVAMLNNHQLATASKITHISGSLIALLAMAEGETTAERIWSDLILDELWQEEQWGNDEFALKNRNDREAEFKEAARFLALSK